MKGHFEKVRRGQSYHRAEWREGPRGWELTVARADIKVAREKAEREGERLQNALTLALQQFGDLSGKGRASVQGTLTNTRKTRKPKVDGDASGDGSGEPAH